jgi:hypothetical protein
MDNLLEIAPSNGKFNENGSIYWKLLHPLDNLLEIAPSNGKEGNPKKCPSAFVAVF